MATPYLISGVGGRTFSRYEIIQLTYLSRRLCLALFLVSLEVSIVSTSLVAITNDLQGFGQFSWLVTAYLLTYTGMGLFMFP